MWARGCSPSTPNTSGSPDCRVTPTSRSSPSRSTSRSSWSATPPRCWSNSRERGGLRGRVRGRIRRVGGRGAEAQARLAQLTSGGSLRLLGPNTNLNAFEEFRTDLEGPAIALITQSGHQGRPVFAAQEIGIRVSHWAPVGNEADLEIADFIRHFSDQEEVGVIAAYVEGFKDGRTFALAADHAARQGVPVVVVKVGRTETGARMAQSHTGKLTGGDRTASAVFRQYGVTRVDGLDELIDTSQLFARTKTPRAQGVCVYSISGGTGAHMADLAAAEGLTVPQLAVSTQERLHEWIPPYLTVSNPVDNGGHPRATSAGARSSTRSWPTPRSGCWCVRSPARSRR